MRGQPNLAGSPEIRLALARLNVLGSVLMIGAHPDDEHNSTLAWFARGRGLRTGYLSVTRGEGGQNLIGPEQGDLLGVIRTEELLDGRRIDGAEQFFTRAIDFGFSKTAQETLEKWGHEEILSDVVWTIRRFRPDVILLCFSGTPRDGHGHHQASAILGKEAFFAAADKDRFPEQLKWVEPWQAKRAFWNVYGRAGQGWPAALKIETGNFNPVLGHSYPEIGAMARSMNRSQGTGMPRRRGPETQQLVLVAGEPAPTDVFDGIDLTWNRVPGASEVGKILAEAARSFDPEHPEKTIPLLLDARARMAGLQGFWVARKRREIDQAISLCAGLWLDAAADRYEAVPGSKVTIRLTALNRSQSPLQLRGISLSGAEQVPACAPRDLAYNQPVTCQASWTIPENQPYSQPYWLVHPRQGDRYTIPDQALIGVPENAPVLEARFRLRAGSQELELSRPVLYRYVDHLRGELTRPLAIVPPVVVEFSEPVLMFPSHQPRKVEVKVRSTVPNAAGEVRLQAPKGWRIEPAEIGADHLRADGRRGNETAASSRFHIADAGEQTVLPFEITPPAGAAEASVSAASDGHAVGMQVIAYPHIRPQIVFPPSEARLVRADIRILAKRIGYVMGAGDEVPEALRQLGCEVTLLTAQDLATADFSGFDAIVTGVRAYNTRPDLRANEQRLFDYAKNGGTLVVQYNVLEYGASPQALEKIGPYPVRVSRDRVTVEEAPVTFPDPQSPLLHSPNQITAADFAGWVQERGLYFASEWDPHYKTLLESHDPGEPPHPGGTLYTRYGQGAYVFTAYSWFRQLPAGVPGAFRIFANLLSAGKVLR